MTYESADDGCALLQQRFAICNRHDPIGVCRDLRQCRQWACFDTAKVCNRHDLIGVGHDLLKCRQWVCFATTKVVTTKVATTNKSHLFGSPDFYLSMHTSAFALPWLDFACAVNSCTLAEVESQCILCIHGSGKPYFSIGELSYKHLHIGWGWKPTYCAYMALKSPIFLLGSFPTICTVDRGKYRLHCTRVHMLMLCYGGGYTYTCACAKHALYFCVGLSAGPCPCPSILHQVAKGQSDMSVRHLCPCHSILLRV